MMGVRNAGNLVESKKVKKDVLTEVDANNLQSFRAEIKKVSSSVAQNIIRRSEIKNQSRVIGGKLGMSFQKKPLMKI